jgi:hypothetical protein
LAEVEARIADLRAIAGTPRAAIDAECDRGRVDRFVDYRRFCV